MKRLRSILLRVAGVLGAGRRNREILEELEAHRDLLAAEYRRAGLADAEARRAAVLRFGSVEAAAGAYRDQRGLPWLESWIQECRLAVRSLRRSPGVVLSMVLVLGLGIGFSTAVATVFQRAVWQGLPVPEPDRVVRLSLDLAGKFSRKVLGAESRFSYPELVEYHEETHALEAVAGMSHASVLWRRDTGIRPVAAVRVTGDYFRALRVIPRIGRVLSPNDALQPVVVISHRLWVDQFESDAAILNRTMVLDRSNYTIIGVVPEEFTGTQIAPVDLWLPLEAALTLAGNATQLSEANTSWLQAIGRLAPGASITSATAEAAVMAARFDAEYPGRRSTIGIASATRLGTEFLRPHDRGKWVATVTGVAGLTGVLLLVCGSNVAALLLARGVTRQRELAVRAALGAGRGRLAQQLVAEVGVIAAASAVIGLAICQLAIRLIAIRLGLPSFNLSFTDPTVIGFVLCFALGVAFFFGLGPARQAMRVDCLSGLKGEGPGVRCPTARHAAAAGARGHPGGSQRHSPRRRRPARPRHRPERQHRPRVLDQERPRRADR